MNSAKVENHGEIKNYAEYGEDFFVADNMQEFEHKACAGGYSDYHSKYEQ